MSSRFILPGAAPLLAAALAACSGAAPSARTAPAPAANRAVIATSTVAPLPVIGPATTEAAITAADLRARLGIVAHDSMQGREVGTPGMARATSYIVRELQRLGLRPAGDDGTYLHRVNLVRTDTRADVTFNGAALGTADIVPLSGLVEDLPRNVRTQGEGRLMYGGYITDPRITPDIDLAPEQLNGNVLVLRFGAAPGANATSRPRFNMQALVSEGSPLQAIILVAEGDLADFWQFAGHALRNGNVTTSPATQSRPGTAPMVFLVEPGAASHLLGQPLESARPRSDLGAFRFDVRRTEAPIEATNIVAVLPGGDPARAGQLVAVGAHHDHDGVGAAEDGDSIFNGADDDGSGTVAMLEIAERLAALPAAERPARSVLFVWHTAEEKGLLGSEAFTNRPTVARDSIVAQLNMDMIGRNAPDSVMLVGSRRLSTELGGIVEAVNAAQTRPFLLDYSMDAPNHPERIYCRSDHYNYARFGIPVTFFTTGLHPQYHTVNDEVELIDFDKMARVAQLISDVAFDLSHRPARPVVDRPAPPLGTPCV
ncbi:M28 family metallopeptidase [Longimicrobium sp.]|uniref:M28 family metallopeptidase n=1 Tax=Longimicrobium sp. TaxID=2029185 RepID=UPI002E34CED1|nr:M28 family peptidase [Longimicrobium sp.]HEX6041868.1 M28 family peptidase [Longimicrobium sp.]